MLRDKLLQERYDLHLAQLEKLVALESDRHHNNGHLRYLAEYYVKEFGNARKLWEHYKGDLVTAFKQFQDSNNLEIITCSRLYI